MSEDRARVIAVAEYREDHPYLTRHEAERALGFTRDIPDSAEVDSLKQDVLRLSQQVASLSKTLQGMTVLHPKETQRLEKKMGLNTKPLTRTPYIQPL